MNWPSTDVQIRAVLEGDPSINNDLFAEFAQENAPLNLNKEWVVWMLGQLNTKHRLNPDWLKLSHNITGNYQVRDSEPNW